MKAQVTSQLISTVATQREQMVADRVAELLSGELKNRDNYNFTNPDNFREAMSNMSDSEIEYLCELLAEQEEGQNRYKRLGLAVYSAAFGYWEDLANERAERETPSLGELLGVARSECDE